MANLITDARAKEAIADYNSADDSLFSNIVTAASDFFRSYTGRDISQATYTEVHNSDGDIVLTNQYPVTRFNRLALGVSPLCYVQNSSADRATIGIEGNVAYFESVSNGVTTNATVSLTGSINTFLASLPSGWSGVASGNYGTWAASDLRPMGNQSAKSPLFLDGFCYDVVGYHWNVAGDVFLSCRYFPAPRVIKISYIAGWSQIPGDIEQAVSELCQVMYEQRKINSAVQSETIGQYSYSLGAREGWEMLSPSSKAVMNFYRSHRLPKQYPV